MKLKAPRGGVAPTDNRRRALARLKCEERDRRDIAIMNLRAKRLNRQVKDTLGYQRLP